ncbi:hypothetical protein ACVXZ4_04130 [Lacisediminihabitans sp. FW035]
MENLFETKLAAFLADEPHTSYNPKFDRARRRDLAAQHKRHVGANRYIGTQAVAA